MGKCCGKHERTKTEEYNPNKQYIDVSLHDERKIGVDFSISKAREKMGVETICEGKMTHDKELKYSPHTFETKDIPSIEEIMSEEEEE